MESYQFHAYIYHALVALCSLIICAFDASCSSSTLDVSSVSITCALFEFFTVALEVAAVLMGPGDPSYPTPPPELLYPDPLPPTRIPVLSAVIFWCLHRFLGACWFDAGLNSSTLDVRSLPITCAVFESFTVALDAAAVLRGPGVPATSPLTRASNVSVLSLF